MRISIDRFFLVLLLLLFSSSEAWPQAKSNKSISISSKSRLCPTNTRRGDREFGGHGPKVTATARVSLQGKTKVVLRLFLHAIETKRDWTETRGTWTYTVYTAPTGYKINRIISNPYSEARYIDNDHGLDITTQTSKPKITGGNLVRRFEIMGDTGGKDIGNCTRDDVYMNVHFNSVKLEIQKLETIISRFDLTGDYPQQVVNKLSKEIRGTAHDQNHWFFTQDDMLWKIPVTLNLATMGKLTPASAKLIDIPPYLQRKGYRRYGDLDYYKGHLFVALEGEGRAKNRPLVAIFNATNMKLIDTLSLKQGQRSIGWIAINPVNGYLYSSEPRTSTGVKRYRITLSGDQVSLSFPSSYNVLNKFRRSVSLINIQSGSFSADGRYFFLVDSTGGNGQLWSFNHRTGKEMYKTIYRNGPMPKAVSHWNIGTKAPGMRGQLHLLMLHPNTQEQDAYSLKHYTIREKLDWDN
ncbi:MAG: hypothetical protein GKS05_12230 [Nitrospirales bacterium]|nr:hypothetical protein [Nitrospirales bacterium]